MTKAERREYSAWLGRRSWKARQERHTPEQLREMMAEAGRASAARREAADDQSAEVADQTVAPFTNRISVS